MPYIKNENGERFHYRVEVSADSPGTLNYQITTAVMSYLQREPVSYRRLNDVIGALESVKQEFYRRVMVPYEEQQAEMNGDVF